MKGMRLVLTAMMMMMTVGTAIASITELESITGVIVMMTMIVGAFACVASSGTTALTEITIMADVTGTGVIETEMTGTGAIGTEMTGIAAIGTEMITIVAGVADNTLQSK